MIRHIVMWDVRGATEAERQHNMVRVKQEFEGLRGRIPGLLQLEVGVDHSAVDYACHVVLFSEFATQAALDAYATHPEHLRVRDALEGVRTARHQVDYTPGAPAHQAGGTP